MEVLLCKETKDPLKIAEKLHRYFGHASPARLKKFVLDSKHDEKVEICDQLVISNPSYLKRGRVASNL